MDNRAERIAKFVENTPTTRDGQLLIGCKHPVAQYNGRVSDILNWRVYKDGSIGLAIAGEEDWIGGSIYKIFSSREAETLDRKGTAPELSETVAQLKTEAETRNALIDRLRKKIVDLEAKTGDAVFTANVRATAAQNNLGGQIKQLKRKAGRRCVIITGLRRKISDLDTERNVILFGREESDTIINELRAEVARLQGERMKWLAALCELQNSLGACGACVSMRNAAEHLATALAETNAS